MTVLIDQLPPLNWTHAEGDAAFDPADGELVLRAAAGVDWTNDAVGAPPAHGATMLGFRVPDHDFTLSARVEVRGGRTTFDAGVLGLWADEDHWAKLCFEYSPQGRPMVVSVVTNTYSDDVNSMAVADDAVFLRVARVGEAWAFHASRDGEHWDFVRLFRLRTQPTSVGFLSQAPMGETCDARFRDIRFSAGAPTDLRDGS